MVNSFFRFNFKQNCLNFKDSNESNDLILTHTFDEWEHFIRTSYIKKKSELKRLNSKHSFEKIENMQTRKPSFDVKLNSNNKLQKVSFLKFNSS